MATVMLMEWAGVAPDQYDQVMRTLDLDNKPPAGGIFHVAGFTEGVLHLLDIWFETLQRERLAAAVQKAKITSQPKVQIYPVHNMFAPNLEVIRKAGSKASPSAG